MRKKSLKSRLSGRRSKADLVGTATHVAASTARKAFSETLNRVSYGGERILLRRHGRDLAAIVPVEDLAILEAIEDRDDVQEARERLAATRAKGERRVSLAAVKKRLGL